MKEWFAEWFDTPWYPILYGDRDENEAEAFVRRLYAFLRDRCTAAPKVLDLACGAGRHSRIFNALGCEVTGFDLSAKSIAKARERGPDSIQYRVGDMRTIDLNESFDLIVNLFTSFGYFDDLTDNEAVLSAVAKHLQPDGCFVLDFMNVPYVMEHLIERETITRGGIEFRIHRYATATHIVKEIKFDTENGAHHYSEKVQAISPDRLQDMLMKQSFVIRNVFGDYNLATFAPQTSPRVILLAQPG